VREAGAPRSIGVKMMLAAWGKLGPYEIMALIGASGMGDVHRAGDRSVGRDLAIKVSTIRELIQPLRLQKAPAVACGHLYLEDIPFPIQS